MPASITLKALLVKQPGDCLIDTHYGVYNQLDPELHKHIRIAPITVTLAMAMIDKANGFKASQSYLNKMLVILAQEPGMIVCCYVYDTRAYVVTLDFNHENGGDGK